MTKRIKTVIQYLMVIGLTVFLVWFSLRSVKTGQDQDKWDYILDTWQMADKGWLMLMALIAMVSHVMRAERWRMLMLPTGHPITLFNGFLSLMIGYLVNLVIPRGGEVSRCYNLYKLDNSPVEVSFGTVVVERFIDLICFAVILAIAFLVETEKLLTFIDTLPVSKAAGLNKMITLSLVIAGLFVVGIIFYLLVKRNTRIRNGIKKVWVGFKDGLSAVFRLRQKNLFIFYSVMIWFLYFLMSYAAIQTFDVLSHLGWAAVLALFAIGSLAMVLPLPGGTGSYHTLVPTGLVFLYQVPQSEAVAFTFIFHGWQTLIMVVGGVFGLISTYIIILKRKPVS
jgi:uncharacterized protein (TIRG00374 family)